MFSVIPCVDIQKGKAVRLFEGDPNKETIYFDSPLEAAQHWVSLGADWVHLVDLDAALGSGDNIALIREIAQTVNARVEVGGGIRSYDTAAAWLDVIDRVILGTVAIKEPQLVEKLVQDFGTEKVVVSIDAKDGLVAVKGWLELSTIKATELAQRSLEQGVSQVIYTDISRDGTMLGVNAAPVKEMREAFPHTLIAGGGVASDRDLELYKELGLQGAIVGRALYEGKIHFPYPAA
ncbi:MAG: 1-(5-phosphoribosyl)-5-[(5-phosphoribosylamino)methylideneamino]imidazole-4-carboxamide isomerase [Trueperaceae bacterium]|nr:1-(5-phosphoribosyl)-5-[(5-phosphoribosylamino)methylideneamino]imidazole-4-carboxamide isomerase [Trueperaceae bacterium]